MILLILFCCSLQDRNGDTATSSLTTSLDLKHRQRSRSASSPRSRTPPNDNVTSSPAGGDPCPTCASSFCSTNPSADHSRTCRCDWAHPEEDKARGGYNGGEPVAASGAVAPPPPPAAAAGAHVLANSNINSTTTTRAAAVITAVGGVAVLNSGRPGEDQAANGVSPGMVAPDLMGVGVRSGGGGGGKMGGMIISAGGRGNGLPAINSEVSDTNSVRALAQRQYQQRQQQQQIHDHPYPNPHSEDNVLVDVGAEGLVTTQTPTTGSSGLGGKLDVARATVAGGEEEGDAEGGAVSGLARLLPFGGEGVVVSGQEGGNVGRVGVVGDGVEAMSVVKSERNPFGQDGRTLPPPWSQQQQQQQQHVIDPQDQAAQAAGVSMAMMMTPHLQGSLQGAGAPTIPEQAVGNTSSTLNGERERALGVAARRELSEADTLDRLEQSLAQVRERDV